MASHTTRVGNSTDGYSATIHEWASVGDFVDELDTDPKYRTSSYAGSEDRHGRGEDHSWYGGESFGQAIKNARIGREDWARLAEEVFDILEAGGIELEVHHWAADRAGAFPCVPDYLAGVPENMRRRLTHASDMSPINVYVDITASAMFDSDQLVKRGASALALCMALQQHRPVTLYLCCALDCHGVSNSKHDAQFSVMRCDTIPMDLAQLAYLFGSAGFFRRLGMAAADKLGCGYTGMWPWRDFNAGASHKFIQRAKEVLGLGPEDLYVPPINAIDESVANPIAWIESHLAHYAQHTED